MMQTILQYLKVGQVFESIDGQHNLEREQNSDIIQGNATYAIQTKIMQSRLILST